MPAPFPKGSSPHRRRETPCRRAAASSATLPLRSLETAPVVGHHKDTGMKRFRRVATVLNLVVVASISAGSFSMCLEDGTNAARAMACCKAHDNCPDSSMARDCCKHERAKDAITQAAAVKSDAAAAIPVPTAVVLPVAVVCSAAYAGTPISTPVAAESPPIFVVQHTFRI